MKTPSMKEEDNEKGGLANRPDGAATAGRLALWAKGHWAKKE
jgi:hypothetical protein